MISQSFHFELIIKIFLNSRVIPTSVLNSFSIFTKVIKSD